MISEYKIQYEELIQEYINKVMELKKWYLSCDDSEQKEYIKLAINSIYEKLRTLFILR